MLRLTDKWVWDFWFAEDGIDKHIFFLQADRTLNDPDLRHWNVSIGHAVSQDWRNWQMLPTAITPSVIDSYVMQEPFDSYTTWTGSIIKHNGTWYMFYTGGKESERGLIQRIGLATSDDLLTWTKYRPKALIEADPEWYEMYDPALWHDQSWRDPWIFKDNYTGMFHAFITARSNFGPKYGRGVIGHAKSKDLIDWEVCPPVAGWIGLGLLEVPQLISMNQQHYLIFSSYAETASENFVRNAKSRQTGVHYLVSNDVFGSYKLLTTTFLAGGKDASLYSGKLINDVDGTLALITFHNFDQNRQFVGTISDPIPVQATTTGHLYSQISK